MIRGSRPGSARATLALVGTLLIAGCQASASGSPSGSPGASPSASAASCAAPPAVCNGPLPAGDYVSDGTGAHITFTLDEHDWSGSQDVPDVGFGLFLADVPEGSISVLRFGGEVYSDPCAPEPGATTPLDPTAAAFIGHLVGLTGMTGNAPLEVEVGGRPGLQVDIPFDYAAACPGGADDRLWLFPLADDDNLHLSDGEQDRVVAVDTGSGLVTFWIASFQGDPEYDHLLGHAAEVMETMTITPLE